jgi:diaminopimelate epimerase
MEMDGLVFKITGVSMGNPHAVINISEIEGGDSYDLE